MEESAEDHEEEGTGGLGSVILFNVVFFVIVVVITVVIFITIIMITSNCYYWYASLSFKSPGHEEEGCGELSMHGASLRPTDYFILHYSSIFNI